MLPRAWNIYSVQVTDINTYVSIQEYADKSSPSQNTEVYVSQGTVPAIDTFENFAGP